MTDKDRYVRAAERLHRWAMHGTWTRMERAARRSPKASPWAGAVVALRHNLQGMTGGTAAHHGR